MRLSIEVTPEQHQRLKTFASFQGKSIKDYVLERVLPEKAGDDESIGLKELEAFLTPRIQAAFLENEPRVSVKEIFEAVHQGDL
jgi:hypothetical protein